MIIWSGLGFLVAVIVFGFSLMANLISDSISGNEIYWKTHQWPLAVSLLCSSLACWFLGNFLRNRKAKVLIDKETGEEVVLKPSHSLFFVPMPYWGPILLVVGIAVLMIDLIK